MKSSSRIIILLLGICFLVNIQADAQSRRERRRMERRREAQREFQRRQKKDERIISESPKAIIPELPEVKEDKPKRIYNYPASVKKDKYRIDILAPFYLSELVKDDKVVSRYKLPDKVTPTLKFYEGLTLAVDTLKKMGYKFDIYVYDITDSLESTATLAATGALQSSDLIIGMLSSAEFPVIAEHVKRHNVNFVSALSPSNYKIDSNPYFTMLQPTLETHCDHVEEQIYNKYGNVKPILFHRMHSTVDSIALKKFTVNNAIEFNKVSCDEMPSRAQVEAFVNKERKNVVVIPLLDYNYAEKILVNLSKWFPDYQFEVWGMPSWVEMPGLKKRDAFPNVSVYYTNPFYFDQTTASGLAVMRGYKKKYGGVADNMVFRGYETMMWYAYLLKKYGTVFNEELWDNGGAPFTRFDIQPVNDDLDQLVHFENQHLYLYRYQGGSFMVER